MEEAKVDEDDDRDDPFDSDVTSEEDEDDLMPERADETDEEAVASRMIQEELKQQEQEAHDLINQELALSGTDALDVVP